jgi:hypothetical protein
MNFGMNIVKIRLYPERHQFYTNYVNEHKKMAIMLIKDLMIVHSKPTKTSK